MSSGTTTRGQLAAHFDLLKRRVDTVTVCDELLAELVGVGKVLLDMYPIDSASAASTAIPDSDEVAKFMHSLLHSPVEVLTDSFFRAFLFALVSLVKIADLYGFFAPQDPL